MVLTRERGAAQGKARVSWCVARPATALLNFRDTRGSFAGVVLFMSLSIVAISTIVRCPEDLYMLYPIAALTGQAMGAIYPIQRNTVAHLIPGGCEASVQGLYAFCGSILMWLPSLLFGVWREVTGSFEFALLPIAVFHLIGASWMFFTIDMDQGVADIADSLSKRLGAWESASDDAPKQLVVQDATKVVPFSSAEDEKAS